MAKRTTVTDLPKIEKMECEDTPPDSGHAESSPRSSGGVPSNVGTTSGSGSDKAQLELPTQDSAVSPKGSPRQSPATSPKSKGAKKSGVRGKSPVKTRVLNFFGIGTSDKASDKAAIVPEEFTTGPSSADNPSTAISSGSREDKKSKSKDKKSKSKEKKSKSKYKFPKSKGPIIEGGIKVEYHQTLSNEDYSSSEEETMLSEVSEQSRQLLPDDLVRKDSISSCDTGAHISMLPSLDEAGAGNEPEKTADFEKGGSTRASTERRFGEGQ